MVLHSNSKVRFLLEQASFAVQRCRHVYLTLQFKGAFCWKNSRTIYLVFNCLEDCTVSDLIDDFKIRWIIQNYSVQYQGGILEKIGQEILD